jgi:hypothetical protein
MEISARPMQPDEARFLEVHHESVRGLAARDYPPKVLRRERHGSAEPMTSE